MVAVPTKGGNNAAGYNLDPMFERGVSVLLSQSPSFYNRVGVEMDPGALGNASCRLLVEAIKSIVVDTHIPPNDSIFALQRLRRWHQDGKVRYEEVMAVADMIDAAENAGLPEEEFAVAELTPIMRRRLHADVVRDAMSEYQNKGDMARVADKIERAKRIGITTSSGTVTMGPTSFATIRELRMKERLPFGIFELDQATDGGLWRGALGLIIARFGGGKSMLLAQLVSQAFLMGIHSGFVTLELPIGMQLARIKANLTGVPTNLIISGEGEDLAMDKLEQLVVDRGVNGHLSMVSMTGGATKVSDVERWVQEEERRVGRQMELVVIDYADELISTNPHEKEYQAMKTVYSGLASMALNEKAKKPRFVWTASQARRKDRGKTKAPDGDDVADSLHKVRKADVAVSIMLNDEQTAADFLITKNRLGKSNTLITGLPVDLSCGRIGPVNR